MRSLLLCALVGACLFVAGGLMPAAHATLPATAPSGGIPLVRTMVASGLNQPTAIAHAGDERLFIAEQGGTIRLVAADGTVQATPFLDLSDQVCEFYQAGLLGLAFHPDYEQNGYFFVNYTAPSGADCSQLESRVSRFQVSSDPAIADPASEVVLLAIPQPFDDNNGGDLAFGLDGLLYIALGDGGSSGDGLAAQDPGSLLGKLLRIAPSTAPAASPPYTIPATNPFVGVPGAREEVWALGLRNPWRFSIDRVTGDLYIGDVGEYEREEVNVQLASSAGGENYGWPCYEGSVLHEAAPCPPATALAFPAFEYEHDQGVAITGGYVYRGAAIPALQGHYLFADYGSGNLWGLVQAAGEWQVTLLDQYANTTISTFGQDAAGELYVAHHALGEAGGGILYRLDPLLFKNYLPLTLRD